MKDQRYKKALAYILYCEGGKVDVKADRGGKTAYGITQMIYSKWLSDMELDDKDVFDITQDDIEAIYYIYWNESKAPQILDDKIATYMFDICVNSGVRRASLTLQRSLRAMGINITVDGIVGKVTLNLVNSDAIDKKILLEKMICERINFYNQIVFKDVTQKKFLKGWIARAERINEN